MSVDEFNMWLAYFQIKSDEIERQQRITKAQR